MNPILESKRNGVSTEPTHEYAFKVFNGRVKVYIDGYIAFCFNQIDFKGFYSYKDDTSLYGLDLYLKDTTIEVYFKTKQVWLDVLRLLDQNM
jgi:hypothetical protein